MILTPTLIMHAICAALCIYGYQLIGTPKAKLGYLLGGLGSIGWLMVSTSPFWSVQSIFFLVAAARGYERVSKDAAKPNR
jgi:hypothetical protein